MTRVLLTVPVLAITLLLAACAGPPAPVETVEPSPTSTVEPTPSESPDPDPVLAGDCTATDGAGPHIPVIYTVFTGDSTTPVTLTFSAFNTDGTVPPVTEEVVGPVVTRMGYPCVSDSSGEIWTLTATSSTPDFVGCVLAFGGQIVATDSKYNEGATTPITADCSGNPGR